MKKEKGQQMKRVTNERKVNLKNFRRKKENEKERGRQRGRRGEVEERVSGQVGVGWQKSRNPVYQGKVHKIMLTP